MAAVAGLHLDPWQQYVLTHGLGEKDDGDWASRGVGCWVPRQNGKGGVIEALELGWLFLMHEKLVLHSAHEYKTAQEAFLRIKDLIEQTPDFDRRVKRVWQANGEQGIELLKPKGKDYHPRLRFVARSRTSGRGFSGPKNILDEGQELTEMQMNALLPTLSAQQNPQYWIFGTPPQDPAAWIYGMKADGEKRARGIAWFDWGCDLDPTKEEDRERAGDVDLWYACNPAMGIRIAEDWVSETELGHSGLGDGFLVERLGAWLPRAEDGHLVISKELWRNQALDAKHPDLEIPTEVAIAIDVTQDRTRTSILVVGRLSDGAWLLSMADHRPGTKWAPQRLLQLKERWNPICIALDTKRAAGSLLHDLEELGITTPEDPDRPQRGDLICPNASEVAQAFGLFVDELRDKEQVFHLDEGPLNVAVAGGITRTLAGAMAWDHKGNTDISPLVAATNGLWGYLIREPLVTSEYDPLANIY